MFGGVVGGKVTAATLVIVMATIFKKPEFHRVPFIIENAAEEQGDEEDDDGGIYAAVTNAADRSGVVNHFNNVTQNNNVNIAMIPNMPAAFAVANSTQMNAQVPVTDHMNNVLQWNHPTNLP